MEFIVSDALMFEHRDKFDFIVLPDVLEHIPEEKHKDLFGKLRTFMHADSKIIIHIPHPKIIEYERIHHPENLQIIDQPLPAANLLQSCYAHNLILVTYESYPLFHLENDYVLIVLKVDGMVQYAKKSRLKIIMRKSIARLKWMFRTI